MKKYLLLVGALALTTASSRAVNGQLVITELDENIVATYNGSAITPTLTGSQDHWTIQLPAGFSLNFPQLYYLTEPESAAEYNQVAVTQPTYLTWDSDIVGTPPSAAFATETILNAGSFAGGAVGTTVRIDLTISDQRSVPDTGSTALMLGIPAVAIFLMTVRRKSTI